MKQKKSKMFFIRAALRRRGTPVPRYSRLFLLFLGAALLSGCGNRKNTLNYEFTSVVRGTLEKTVSSTGTLNPVATVKVLPRMSGKVEKINVDFNDSVKKGDILAELNTDVLRLKREQQLAQVIKARANYELQRMNHENQEKLAEKNLIAEYELKNSRTNFDVQRAELAAAEANLESIEIEINQYAFITSAIDGTVLERNINVGDTVVDSSSSNSSAIFTLAENLEEMQIESWVGELDIASIREGQEVRFTLESLPGRTYRGTVESKRLMPSVQDNVVSYKVIVSVNNQDGSLLPGMTCAVEFIEERNENILVISNAALRFRPTSLGDDEIEDIVFNAGLRGLTETEKAEAIRLREEAQKNAASAGTSQTAQGGLTGLMMPGGNRMMRPPGGGRTRGSPGQSNGDQAVNMSPPKPLWFIGAGGKPDAILVRTGISDGSRTEIEPLFSEETNSSAGLPVAYSAGDTPLTETQFILRERVQ